jgi:predicted acetylornithine/succinylornithine family transaminase
MAEQSVSNDATESSRTQQILDRGRNVLIGNYARVSIDMVRGEGTAVWDSDGKQFLDLFAGFGGCILGHCHPALIAAAAEQARKLWHVGNTFHTEPQIEFAERLNQHAFRGQAFFCHSGAEANEAACKLARLRGSQSGGKRWKILSLLKSFHGRTLAMIAATGNPIYRAGFGPEVPGFTSVPGGDFDALEQAVDDETAGIIMEPIQGEGGVNLYPADYPQRVRKLCDQRGLTLIFDEVWTGGGRTGKWFAHQHFCANVAKPKGAGGTVPSGSCTVEPDIMTLGKAVGGGLPVGVMYAKPDIAKLLVPGTHGCTLGGNPICMAVASAIFDVIEREKLVDHAAAMGELAFARLRNEPKIKDKVVEVRGCGLMLGIQLKDPPEQFMAKAFERGLLVNLTAKQVIRLAPPINISREVWLSGLDRVVELIASL